MNQLEAFKTLRAFIEVRRKVLTAREGRALRVLALKIEQLQRKANRKKAATGIVPHTGPVPCYTENLDDSRN